MKRRYAWAGGLILGIGLMLIGSPAHALITVAFPLRDGLNSEHIFLAKVEKLNPDKLTMVLKVQEDLKGKAPFRRLPIDLKGDKEAEKGEHTPKLLKRVAPDLPLVVFANKRGKKYIGFAYTNGTWFQMIGYEDPKDPANVRWAFTHFEPYLRRTFKGTTAEMRQVVIDALAGKKEPPGVDEKEQPGLGPEVSRIEDRGSRIEDRGSSYSGPLFAVIPTFVIVGPLALLASLFPAVFGGAAGLLRRWLAFISIASLNSTLGMLHIFFRDKIMDTWWGSTLALSITLLLITIAGAVWAGWRFRAAVQRGQADGTPPRRGEQIVLWVLSLCCVGMALYCLFFGGGASVLLQSPWAEMLAVWVGVWVATLYTVYLRLAARPGGPAPTTLPIEAVILWAMVFTSANLLAANWPRERAAVVLGTAEAGSGDSRQVEPAWIFKPTDKSGNAILGRIISTPLMDGDRIYVAAAHQKGFGTFGAVYCLDRATGSKSLWAAPFDNDGDLKQVFSTPCLADGRLYIGEGFHTDSDCKLFCLDANTGEKLWDFPTSSHTESGPTVADGKVFFGAGDDGVFCLDAKTGKELWHFKGPHVDTGPAVAGKRLYAGSGYGKHEVFCLDTDTGDEVWRVPTDLPSFGSPVVDGGQVFFGLGNGDFISSADVPAGALLCLKAHNGEQLWRFDNTADAEHGVGDAVHGKPAVDERHVYFGSRDHYFYCIDRQDGRFRWRQSLGSAVVASPALVTCPRCGAGTLYAVASGGLVCSLDAESGHVHWTYDIAAQSGLKPQMLSSPRPVPEREDGSGRRRLYFGSGLEKPGVWTPALYCLEEILPGQQPR
jgi:outer membrane protein assembly factor BamB